MLADLSIFVPPVQRNELKPSPHPMTSAPLLDHVQVPSLCCVWSFDPTSFSIRKVDNIMITL